MKFALLKKEDKITIGEWLDMSSELFNPIYNKHGDCLINMKPFSADTYILHKRTKNGYKTTQIDEKKALKLFKSHGKEIITSYCQCVASDRFLVIDDSIFCMVGRIEEFFTICKTKLAYIHNFKIFNETKNVVRWISCLNKEEYGISKEDFAIGTIIRTQKGIPTGVMNLQPIPSEVVARLNPIDVEIKC